MPISPLPLSYNQVSWPGVGDIDDCQVIAAFWAVVAAGHATKSTLPSVTTFRAKAGNPDDPNRADGLTNAQSLAAIKALWPKAGAYSYVGGSDGFYAALRSGSVISLSVKSSLLPSAMRYGFAGLHQIAVANVGGSWLVMNPLQPSGTKAVAISASALSAAARGFLGDGKFHAVVVPMKPTPPPPVVDPTVALKAEITALKKQVADKQTIIDTLTAKIASARSALL